MAKNMEDLDNESRRTSDQRLTDEGPVDAEDTVDVREHDNRDLIKLLIKMRDGTVNSQRSDWILEECKWLFRRDYECKFVDNLDNNIPGVHPKVLVIPVAEKKCTEQGKKMNFDAVAYLMQEQDSSFINVTRFPCPVILFNGKYVCRSRYPSILQARCDEQTPGTSTSDDTPRLQRTALNMARMRGDVKKYSFARVDANFLQSLDVSHLIDLTNSTECDIKDDITNSENLRNIYQHIEIISMPYPGPKNFSSTLDKVEMTEKYLLDILQKLIEGNGGVLIQSVAGCYRTALFTSLLRLSLWADGVIHKSLEMREITFLTLGYDWYFFGYRIKNDQSVFKEMLTFFFTFLSVISTNEFSITRMFEEQNEVNQASSVLPRFQPSRRELLREIGINLWKNFDKSYQYYISFNRKSE